MRNYDTTSDRTRLCATLLERAADEDHLESKEACREIDARYRPVLLGFARRMGLDQRGAENLAQDSLIALVSMVKSHRIDLHRSPSSYLLPIARHKLIDHANAQDSLRPLPLEYRKELGDPAFAAGPDPSTEAWKTEQDRAIAELAVKELRRHFRRRDVEIWTARKVEEHSAKAVAERHGITVNAVDTVLHRITAFLRELEPIIRARF